MAGRPTRDAILRRTPVSKCRPFLTPRFPSSLMAAFLNRLPVPCMGAASSFHGGPSALSYRRIFKWQGGRHLRYGAV